MRRAREKKTDVEQLNAVTSGVAESIRYVGDWRLVKGAFNPRPLATIARSGYGDCKDFTVTAGAI